MGYNFKIIREFNNFIPKGSFGLISFIIFVGGLTLSYLEFPGYSLIKNMVSDLGVGPGSSFFNCSLIISGMLTLLFFIRFYYIFHETNVHHNYKKITIGLCIFSSISYIFVGIFPSTTNFIIIALHIAFSSSTFVFGMICILLISYLIYRHTDYPNLLIIFGILFALSVVVYFSTLLPFFEWLIVIFYSVWILVNSFYIFTKDIKMRLKK
ncbi:MAG: DUF998 domain-containing protein [Candidatus Lokiarchaeota archaeon]|nr:DUF998 domain-containing protein [Candidatus Lokiarchaeota archaeon]MBD3201828.1 DUF998 domain-containing protein [Candidatus Lokiarchaeota archaeon]